LSETYRKAGVNIGAGEKVIERIRKSVRSTFTKNVLTDIGSFGAFYRASFPGIADPVLVSSVDGVGTKLKIAFASKRFETVGQDLVNHCVNDIAVCGAQPLFFMDYFATGKLSPRVVERVISGFVRACKENSCSLIGGETAEMPGLYRDGEFDIAGTIVGVVDRKKIVDGKRIKAGDVLIGLPSTGLHTNGYSLARKVLLPRYSLQKHVKELNNSLDKILLTVHRSYLSPIRYLVAKDIVHGMSHITGGGIVGNTMRVIPRGLKLSVDWESWQRPAIFSLIQKKGNVPENDMRRTFNLGIGMIFVVASRHTNVALRILRRRKEHPVVIGEVIRN
jgi:phosphoribosylformylglycinamidine cyclo-ligase